MNKVHANTEIVFDTIIDDDGGRTAGLTAATVLGRSLRQVLFIDTRDQSDMHAQVNIAVASGQKTAMSINTFLSKIDHDSG